jgi:hypothetical protein
MSVTKLVIRSVMIAGLIGASARGDAILTLGLFSSPTDTAVSSQASSGSSLNLAMSNSAGTVAANPAPTSSPVLTNFSPATFQAIPSVTTSPASASTPAPTPTYDALINFGNGPFLNASSLTNGGAQAWYDSSKISGLFGGQPTASQISSFDSTVLARVQQTFALSGVPVTLTDNPNASAAHMLSVVSNTVNPSMTNAIGMTNIGGNGFHFIDNSATYANSVDQLEWIVAHNVAHELMLAFGVPEVHDQTGQYIDSTIGKMSMFLNPNATFSTGAVQDLLSRNFLQSNNALFSTQAQLLSPTPAPEPATLAAWGLVIGTVIAVQRARSRRASV